MMQDQLASSQAVEDLELPHNSSRRDLPSPARLKLQLNANDEVVRAAALHKVLDYGEPGLDVLIEVLNESSDYFSWLAYQLLSQRPERKAIAALKPYGFQHAYETITVNQRGSIIKRELRRTRMFREYLNGTVLDLVPIPRGSFTMGAAEFESGHCADELPCHKVEVSTFWISLNPVTQAQYQTVMGKNPSRFKGANRPVEQVSWNDAVLFCQRLTHQTGRIYRLPSEAEWEYACRAGTSTPFHFGPTMTAELANFNGAQAYDYATLGFCRNTTTGIRQFPANSFGLFDMHGNIWEWCADTWHGNYHDAPADGTPWITEPASKFRVVRGGSWSSAPKYCRSASRHKSPGHLRVSDLGFRVVRTATWNSV